MKSFFDNLINESKANEKLAARRDLQLNLTEDILIQMERRNVTKAELSRRLGKSRSYVSQVLDGDRNMTIGSLSDICYELGIKPKIDVGGYKPHEFVQSGWVPVTGGNVLQLSTIKAERHVTKEFNIEKRWSA